MATSKGHNVFLAILMRKQVGKVDESVRGINAHNDLKGDGHVVTYNLGLDDALLHL